MDGGARWDAVEKQKLVYAQTEGDPNLDVQRPRRLFQIAVDEEIKEPLPAQNAKDKFSGQACILGLHRPIQLGAQHVIRVRVLFRDAQQDIERNRSCLRNWHKQTWNHTMSRKGNDVAGGQ